MAKSTLNYSEKINAFQSFQDVMADGYIQFGGKLFAIKADKIYSVSPEAKTYDPTSFYIRLLINENYQYTKVFDNVEYYSSDIGLSLVSAKFIGTRQNSLTINNSNVESRENTYKFAIPRDTNEERMRDKQLICDYVFKNINNTKKFTIPYIKTRYRYSMI